MAISIQEWREKDDHLCIAPWNSQVYSLIFSLEFYFLIKQQKKQQYQASTKNNVFNIYSVICLLKCTLNFHL